MVRQFQRPIVLHITSVHPVFDTRIFVKECRSLVKAGYEVHLLAQYEKREEVKGVKIEPLPKVRRKKERFFKVIPELIRSVFSFPKTSIVHFHDPELIPVCFLFKVFGYKVVYDIHEHTPKDFLTKEWLPFLLRYPISKSVELLEFLADKFFDGIITVVPPVSKRFSNKNHAEISNYPLLSDYYYKKNEEEVSRDMSAIYIGDITYRRGIRQMVEAMGILNKSAVSDIKLVLGGKFSPPEIREELEELEGWPYCKFIGWQLMTDIWDQLHKASVGIVTLQNVPSHLLLLPVKMFEYMAAGLPVIASDFPMFREIIEKHNCGILVDPGNPREIADAIEWTLNNPSEAKEMGSRGKKAVREYYNWSTEERELIEFYKNLSQ